MNSEHECNWYYHCNLIISKRGGINRSDKKELIMYRHLTTTNGQILFKVNKGTGFTDVFDGNGDVPEKVATIRSTNKNDVMNAIRGLGTFLKKHQALASMGIEFEPKAFKLLTGILSAKIKAVPESAIPEVMTEKQASVEIAPVAPKRVYTRKQSWG